MNHRLFFLKSNNLFFSLYWLEVFDFVFCFRLNMFISKISNLLLPFGAEGASCYTQPMIYPLNISMMFFNDLFIYFAVVVFPLFGASKGLIRDLQTL